MGVDYDARPGPKATSRVSYVTSWWAIPPRAHVVRVCHVDHQAGVHMRPIELLSAKGGGVENRRQWDQLEQLSIQM